MILWLKNINITVPDEKLNDYDMIKIWYAPRENDILWHANSEDRTRLCSNLALNPDTDPATQTVEPQ